MHLLTFIELRLQVQLLGNCCFVRKCRRAENKSDKATLPPAPPGYAGRHALTILHCAAFTEMALFPLLQKYTPCFEIPQQQIKPFVFIVFSLDMDVWRVSRSCPSGDRKVESQPLWILWTLKVLRRLTMLSTRWGTETCALITMNQAQFLVPQGGWTIVSP